MENSIEKEKLNSYIRTLAKSAKALLYKCPVVFFGTVLYLMYVMTVGEKMFSSKAPFSDANTRFTSTVLFVAASCISQIMFFAFSSHTSGVMSSPISESFLYIQGLHCALAKSVPAPKLFSTLFACTALSAMLTSAGFFALRALRADRAIHKIPSAASKALFVSIGILCVFYANDRLENIKVSNVPSWAISAAFNSVGVCLTIFCFVCRERAPAVPQYSVLWIGVLFTAAFYLCAWACRMSLSSLVSSGWLLCNPRKPISMKIPSVAFSKIQKQEIVRQLPAIAKISALNLLQFPINFPSTKARTGESTHVRKELLANGLSNAMSMFLGCTTYVLPSSTIAVYEAGSRSKIDTLLFAGALGLVTITGYKYLFYIPFVVLDLLFLCLGLNIIFQSSLSAVQEGWGTFAFVIFISLTSVATSSILWGAVVAGAMYALKHTLKHGFNTFTFTGCRRPLRARARLPR
ncbi:uncharacterized protein NEMAJ01_0855 [Nematocida major]|uniref:uncharacterized protein n=1 Tax=Nematocida major TaxID=1912982 RepID=UPI0020087167|nr:uncharacterized protein NEMAJ01_0855 [Nematocida major]KAH9385959.1 hypothetical protein NEMAJ01_0855 [Nematocida major]